MNSGTPASNLESQLELIGMVSNKLGSGERFSDQLRFVTSKICEVLNVDACIIRGLNENHLELLYSNGVEKGHLIQSLPTDVGIALELVSTRKPVCVENSSEDPITKKLRLNAKNEPGHFTFCSYAGVPMIAHEQVVGIIGVYKTTEQRTFSESELNLLQILANSAGLALRNDHLISRILGAESNVKRQIMELLKDSVRHIQVEGSTEESIPDVKGKKHQIEYDIRQDNLNFLVYYQPIRAPKSIEPLGFEALIRWDHPEFGVLQPNSFIPVAEASGLISKVGNQVYDIVAKQFSRLFVNGCKANFVTLNVSIFELSSVDFPSKLAKIFTTLDVLPQQVVLEITERSPLEPNSEAVRNIFLHSEMGFRVFLDDFGTGHTSLSYLLEYSFHGIKIDKKFIPTSRLDERRVKVIRNLNKMAHDLGLLVVAEGIETIEQEELCSELNFDLLQGFGIGRPEPVLGRRGQIV
ncbi:MAG: EAL domain-containing protein [Sumerlaeia bacterium]